MNMVLPQDWSELKFIDKFAYKSYNDFQLGPTTDYIYIYYHHKSKTYFGMPYTDNAGWAAPRPTILSGKHTTYKVPGSSFGQPNWLGDISLIKFDVEQTSRGVVFIEKDPIEAPLTFIKPDYKVENILRKIVTDRYEGKIELTIEFTLNRHEGDEEYWAEGMTPKEILDDLLEEGYHQFEKDYTRGYPEAKAISAKKIS